MSQELFYEQDIPSSGVNINTEIWEKIVALAKVNLPLFHLETKSIWQTEGSGEFIVGARTIIEFTIKDIHYMIARDYLHSAKRDVLNCFKMKPDYSWELLPEKSIKEFNLL